MYGTLAGLLLLSSVGGCGHSAVPKLNPLPNFALIDDSTALEILRQRAESVQRISGQCALKLTGNNGESVHLDAAIVMARPDRLRLRAWKMGQAVFDLTLRPDGLWVETPTDPSRAKDVLPATVGAAEFGRQFLWFTGGFFTEAGPMAHHIAGDRLIFERGSDAGGRIICQVDRPTLTPGKFEMIDPDGRVRFTLDLSDYRDFGGVLWATHLLASTLEGQKIDITLSDLEFNGELAPHAFDPPPRAIKRQETTTRADGAAGPGPRS